MKGWQEEEVETGNTQQRGDNSGLRAPCRSEKNYDQQEGQSHSSGIDVIAENPKNYGSGRDDDHGYDVSQQIFPDHNSPQTTVVGLCNQPPT
jgi:hypothetical protein